MAGSKRWFGYEADNGDNFAYQLDESIYESANLGFGGVAAGAIPLLAQSTVPLTMRKVNCYRIADDETLRASFYVGTRADLDTLAGGGQITVDGVAWSVSSVQGENRVIVPRTDTEQLDGDIDQNFAA